MTPYRLDFGRYTAKGYESFGQIIIELPMNLHPLPDSNEADMSAILSEKDLERVGWKFGTRGKRPQPRFYLIGNRPGKFEYPDPATFKTEYGYEVWITR